MGMKITLRNDFHDSEVAVMVATLPATLTPSQVQRVRDELCGNRDCKCGGIRGPQYAEGIGKLSVCADGDSEGRATWTVETA